MHTNTHIHPKELLKGHSSFKASHNDNLIHFPSTHTARRERKRVGESQKEKQEKKLKERHKLVWNSVPITQCFCTTYRLEHTELE